MIYRPRWKIVHKNNSKALKYTRCTELNGTEFRTDEIILPDTNSPAATAEWKCKNLTQRNVWMNYCTGRRNTTDDVFFYCLLDKILGNFDIKVMFDMFKTIQHSFFTVTWVMLFLCILYIYAIFCIVILYIVYTIECQWIYNWCSRLLQ